MKAPNSLMDPSPQATIDGIMGTSQLSGKYAAVADRLSAYEMLAQRLQAAPTPEEKPAPGHAPSSAPPTRSEPRAPKEEPGLVEKVTSSSAFRSMLRSAGTVIGREITRSIFGTSRRSR
jgi:hypothetical protein